MQPRPQLHDATFRVDELNECWHQPAIVSNWTCASRQWPKPLFYKYLVGATNLWSQCTCWWFCLCCFYFSTVYRIYEWTSSWFNFLQNFHFNWLLFLNPPVISLKKKQPICYTNGHSCFIMANGKCSNQCELQKTLSMIIDDDEPPSRSTSSST